jgi:hypothetical protein
MNVEITKEVESGDLEILIHRYTCFVSWVREALALLALCFCI